ncbi:MAG: phage tail tape measure protein, partial [Agathobacter sp.]
MAFGAKVKLSVNKTGARNFRNEIQKFVDDSTASNPIKIKNIKLELNKSQQAQLRRNLQNYLNTSGDNLTIKINKIDASGAVKQLRSQLETMLSGLSITGLKDFLGTDGVGTTYERAAAAADKLATAQENVRRKSEEVNASVRVLNTLQKNANSAYTYGNKITNPEQVTKITSDYQLLCTQIEKTKNLEGEEQQVAIQGITQKIAALRAYIDEIYENQAASKRTAAEEEKNNQVVIASLTKVNTLYKKLSSYSKNNPRVMADGLMGGQINSWMSQLASGTQFSEDELKSIENGFAAIAMRAKEAGLEGKTFGDRILAAYKKFGGWTIITRTLTFAIQRFKQMVQIVTQLDTAMTELRKVTDLTEQTYNVVFDRAISRAKELGATVADTITATADFSRLGYGIEDAEKLADAAIIYKNVGDGIENITDASESIISTLKAFGEETVSAMEIVDKFNEVGNNFAISSKGVGDALMRSSAALAVAGNTIDESIALAVGMN